MTVRASAFRVFLSACLLLVAGCVPVEFLSDTPEELEAIAGAIAIGETTRNELHADLGEPMAVSADRSVEVFRAASGHDVTGIVWLGPAPPLFGGRDVTGYLMLRYDSDSIVSEAVNGFTAEMEPVYDADRGDRRDLALSMPPYQFRASYNWPTYDESLVTSLPDRWPPLPPNQCRLLFVPKVTAFRSLRELYIDDSLVLTYHVVRPYVDSARESRFLYQFLLSPGRHTAAVEIPVYKGDRFEADWKCSRGETIHLYDQVVFGPRPDRERWHSGMGPVGSLDPGPEVDLQSSNRKLVVYHNGLTQHPGRKD